MTSFKSEMLILQNKKIRYKPLLKKNIFYKESLKILKNYKKNYNDKELIYIEKIIRDGILLEKKETNIYNNPDHIYNKIHMIQIKKYKIKYQNEIIFKLKKFEDNIKSKIYDSSIKISQLENVNKKTKNLYIKPKENVSTLGTVK